MHQLERLEVADYPHLKKEQRGNVRRRYEVIISPPTLISDPEVVKDSWHRLRTGKWRSKGQT